VLEGLYFFRRDEVWLRLSRCWTPIFWQAASAEGTQVFLLIGTLFLLPIIVMYTGWSYWVFRGKRRGDAGYH
jgi:cytochrome bd-type quinol oxidase subunit 2